MLTLSCLLILLQPPASQTLPRTQPICWQFFKGQEFYVEENHRQLYLMKLGDTQLNSYLDYSLLEHYQVKAAQPRFVELEATWEKVRINNPNEAGKEAIEVLKKHEGAKHTYRLRRQDQLWQLDTDRRPAMQETVFSTLLFTLGNSSFDVDHPTWTMCWPISTPTLGQVQLAMNMQTKTTENPQRLRSEIRTEFQRSPAEKAGTLQIENVPTATPGLGFFDTKRGRWDYLDFRVVCVFKLQQNERKAEIRQDFSAIYRIYDSKPVWP
jgi:hypothetical protein